MADFNFAFDFLFSTVNSVQDEKGVTESPFVRTGFIRNLEIDEWIGTLVSAVIKESLKRTEIKR